MSLIDPVASGALRGAACLFAVAGVRQYAEAQIRRGANLADTKMVKSIGEHWVCATLARHGWAAALTRDGLARTDVLAVGTSLPHRPLAEIQVKTATGSSNRTSWVINRKAQEFARSAHEWFVFVAVPAAPAAPRGFVVPRDHVSAATWVVHENWRTDPNVSPGTRNTTIDRARVNMTVWAAYEDRWDLLATPTEDAPVLLPGWIRERTQEGRVGLPPGHPWRSGLPAWGAN
jgi:hypothetical protein